MVLRLQNVRSGSLLQDFGRSVGELVLKDLHPGQHDVPVEADLHVGPEHPSVLDVGVPHGPDVPVERELAAETCWQKRAKRTVISFTRPNFSRFCRASKFF